MMRKIAATLATVSLLALLFHKTATDWLTQVLPLSDSKELVVAIRVTPLSYSGELDEHVKPYEQTLLEQFGELLKKNVRFLPVESEHEVFELLRSNRAHLGAGWLQAPDDPYLIASPPIQEDDLVLVQSEAAIPIENIENLSGKQILLATGDRASRHIAAMPELARQIFITEQTAPTGLEHLAAVSDQKAEFTVVPRQIFQVAQIHYPDLQSSIAFGKPQPIVWLMRNSGPHSIDPLRPFFDRLNQDNTLVRLKEAYFGFRRRLTKIDALEYLGNIETELPKYQMLFKDAQIRSGIDWRLLAALAYQESQWDPMATSPTGVRGMMMLTEETADRMKVSNRLDVRQSILAGADYLAILRDELPDTVTEPDRTWLAIAAYNLGMGHLRGARAIAKGKNANPDSWYEMKKILPLLSRPEIFARLKSGKARGGEAVIMVENIRAFYDILARRAPPYYLSTNGPSNFDPKPILPVPTFKLP